MLPFLPCRGLVLEEAILKLIAVNQFQNILLMFECKLIVTTLGTRTGKLCLEIPGCQLKLQSASMSVVAKGTNPFRFKGFV